MADHKWQRYPLSEICEINPAKKDLQGLDREAEVSFLPMACISEEGKILNQEKRKLKDVIKGFAYFKEEDVLVAKITPCFENGKRAIAGNLLNGVGFGSTEFHVLRPNGMATPRWVFYAISQDDFRNIAKSQMTGTAGQKRVPRRVLEEYEIPVPEVNEQEVISEKIETQFTRLDAAIKSLRIIKNKLEFYRRSILKAAFVKRSHWTEKSFVDCFRNASLGDKKIKQRNYLEEGEYPVVDQGERLIGGYTNNKEKLQDIALPAIIFGDHTRRFKYIDFKFAVGADGVKLLKIADFLFPKFAFYHSLILDLPNKGYSMHFQYLKKSIIRFPSSLEEQQEVVGAVESRFSVIDKVEEVVDNALLKAERLRKSILKAAFEGKLVEV